MALRDDILSAVSAGAADIRTKVSSALAKHITHNKTSSDDLQFVQFWLDLLDRIAEDAEVGMQPPSPDANPIVTVPGAVKLFIEGVKTDVEFTTKEVLEFCLTKVRLNTNQLRRHASTGRRALDQNVNVTLGLLSKDGTIHRTRRGHYKVIATD